jgi:hypothetical protein
LLFTSATIIIDSLGYCIKPGAGIFLLFSPLPSPTMSREFSFISAWSLLQKCPGILSFTSYNEFPAEGF